MGWENVKLPSRLVESVDARVETDPAYTSRAEFVRRAVEEHLRRPAQPPAVPAEA